MDLTFCSRTLDSKVYGKLPTKETARFNRVSKPSSEMDYEMTKVSVHNDIDKSVQLNAITTNPTGKGSQTFSLELPENNKNNVQDSEEGKRNCWVRTVEAIEAWAAEFWASYRQTLHTGKKILMAILYVAFVSYSWYYRFGDQGSIILLVITALLALRTFASALNRPGVTHRLSKLLTKTWKKLSPNLIYMRYFLYPLVVLGISLYVCLEILATNPENMQSLVGIFGFISITFVLSTKASQVNWHPVFWGFAMQFILAILTLRTEMGQSVFQWMGDAVHTFTSFSDYGGEFVFGPDFQAWGILFKAGSTIVFFNSFIFVLVHLGVVDACVSYGGRALAFCLGTGPVESVVAVTNIFLGQ
ncbi:hypothetical protein EGW08_006901, partial [Elysia chlorotica]